MPTCKKAFPSTAENLCLGFGCRRKGFFAKVSESDFHELPASVNRSQKADLIVLASAKFPISMKKHRLIATRKTFAHTTRKKIEYEIDGFQFDEQKTKELNQANWEIEIKELPPDTP